MQSLPSTGCVRQKGALFFPRRKLNRESRERAARVAVATERIENQSICSTGSLTWHCGDDRRGDVSLAERARSGSPASLFGLPVRPVRTSPRLKTTIHGAAIDSERAWRFSLRCPDGMRPNAELIITLCQLRSRSWGSPTTTNTNTMYHDSHGEKP